MNSFPDWARLKKALLLEAEYGFQNLQGQQYQFSEFMTISLRKPPANITKIEQKHWQNYADKFIEYPALSLVDRKNLLAQVTKFLEIAEKTAQLRSKQPNINEKNHQIPADKVVTINRSPVTQINPKDVSQIQENIKVSLVQKLSDIRSLGSRKIEALHKLGLYTVKDILFYYPRDHIDYARQISINQLVAGETVTIVGTIKKCSCFTSPKNNKLTILDLTIKDQTGQIKINRFYAGNRYSRGWQESIKRRYTMGTIVAVSGLVKISKYGTTLDNPEIEVLGSTQEQTASLKIGRVVPVYPLTEGVPADWIREAVVTCLPATEQLNDPLPATLKNQYGLIELSQAIANIHFPVNSEIKEAARRRLVFDEFFYLQLGFLQRRQKMRQQNTTTMVIQPTGYLIEKFQELLPFKLTNAQQRVISEILTDIQKSTPMNRLVQGDVGSGKTVVAVMALIASIQSGYQAALMAPTEVLAEQHYRKLVGWFNLLHLPVELLTGSTKTAKRREIYRQLMTGELPVIVGTHALIQDKVNFQKLGLVVIDEQHRFGVYQRAKLQQKGEQPHVLTMTATPIPRTLALTLHGDLDVSQIDELPPGRQNIITTAISGRERNHAYDLIRREIAQGRQVYVVLPLVEESEKISAKAAVAEYENLSQNVFPQFKVGLLHGKMSSMEKDQAITNFAAGNTDILVATTVVEVGVDVPNATVMLIENAERFGLSQLHQLRGRVGRGSNRSYCILMSSSNSGSAKERLQVLVDSQDGFWISEMDMQLRGPGEVLGSKQSGLADFALASLVEDEEVLNIARDAAEKIILNNPTLKHLPKLRDELDYRFNKLLGGSILT